MPTLDNDPHGVVSVTITQGVKAVAAAGTPEKLVAANTYVERVTFLGRKAPGTVNTGAVYIGVSSTGGQNYHVLLADEEVTFSALPGKKLNLFDFYVDAATNADAVAYTAFN